jgi:hypothetical protein
LEKIEKEEKMKTSAPEGLQEDFLLEAGRKISAIIKYK